MRNYRVLISDTIHLRRLQRGVSLYFDKVVDGILKEYGSTTAVCSPQRRNYGGATHIQTLRVPRSHRLNSWMQDFTASWVARASNPAIYFSPYFGNARTQAIEIYTVYDMIYEGFPQYFDKKNDTVRNFIEEKKRCFDRASALIAISNSTALDIRKYYPQIDRSKIVVIPLAVDDFYFQVPPQLELSNHKKPYFLFVGHRSGYKNFLRLVAAFGKSGLASAFDLNVVSSGSVSWSVAEMACLEEFNLQHSVHLLISVADDRLRELYASSVALAYPSEHEGFGLPILEALASGTLVITSNVASMPEVGGDVAWYFDPCDVDSIAHQLQEVANLHSEERERRIRLGKIRASHFTWQQCQQQTVALFRQLAGPS